MGVPIWFILGILIKFSPKIAEATGVTGKVSVADAVMYGYIGLSVGDLLCGWLSQIFTNRKKVVLSYLLATLCMVIFQMTVRGLSVSAFLALCFFIGVASGYWGLFVTIASEQFGTNIRATVTVTVPNFVRGAVIPITLAYKTFESSHGTIYSVAVVGVVCLALAFVAILYLDETFGKDLNYYEMT